MRIHFTKMHGVGNDFMVFDAPTPAMLPGAARLRMLADRHTGIGFDQALVLEAPRRPDTAVYYRIFNSDGIEVEQCGNGARCVAALLHRRGRSQGRMLTLDSPAGLIRARIDGDHVVSVDMGVPAFDPRALPFDAPFEADPYSLDVAGQSVEIGAVSMGNPHAVLVVTSVEGAAIERLGPAIESHPRFQKRVNVAFMEIVDRSHIRLRVYERGAGETLACGTGACAAVVIGRRRGQLDPEVHVSVRGGKLRVNWQGGEQKGPQAILRDEDGGHVWLTGPAEISFEGHVEV
jgi:diaminopimelate epimerase